MSYVVVGVFFFFQAEDGIRDWSVTGVQTCALPISVFVGLIITNCIIMGRLEAFALGNKPGPSFLDAIGNAMGYAWILVAVAVVREIIGSGAISLPGMGQVKFIPSSWFIAEGGLYENNNLFILPPMALVVVGIIIWIQRSRNTKLIEEN